MAKVKVKKLTVCDSSRFSPGCDLVRISQHCYGFLKKRAALARFSVKTLRFVAGRFSYYRLPTLRGNPAAPKLWGQDEPIAQ
ncbi:TPA: hypothetical protein SML50_001704 [Serratia fonticola]|nr:hypothetical protein [Serratia fonticola]